MKITITIDEHLLDTIEEKRGNKSKSEQRTNKELGLLGKSRRLQEILISSNT